MSGMERRERTRYVDTYAHYNHSVGVMVEYICETTVPTREKTFQEHVHQTAMQIAADNPADVNAVLEQYSIKNPDKKVADLLSELVETFRENIELVRFVRWDTEMGSSELGDDDPPPEPSSAVLRVVR